MKRDPRSVEAVFEIRPGSQPGSRPAEREQRAPKAERDEPFRLLVLADFSGRGSRGVAADLAGRRPRRVDRDDLEEVLAKLEPELRVGTRAAGVHLELRPRTLDDLHPDALWRQLEVFGELRALRRRLSNPATFAQAAAEIGGPERAVAKQQAPRPAAPAAEAGEPAAGLFEAALAATESGAGSRSGSELVDAILAELVVPSVPATPGQAELVASLDAAAAETMRALLRAPALRSLESAWRALDLLVRRIETDARLEIWILDVTTSELLRDLAAGEDPRASGTWRALFEPDAAGEGTRWAAWTALDLRFGAQAASLALLARIGRLAEAAATPFLAGAHESLAGCASLAEHADPHDWTELESGAAAAWRAVRAGSGARWLLLALPRVMLRNPYGARTSPVEGFAFEELASPPRHEDFLWGSGALLPLLALAQACSESGWDFTTQAQWEIDRLPVPVFSDADGESAVQPAAEVVLTDRARERLASAGLVPLATVRDTDRVRVGPLLSVAGAPIAGRWES